MSILLQRKNYIQKANAYLLSNLSYISLPDLSLGTEKPFADNAAYYSIRIKQLNG